MNWQNPGKTENERRRNGDSHPDQQLQQNHAEWRVVNNMDSVLDTYSLQERQLITLLVKTTELSVSLAMLAVTTLLNGEIRALQKNTVTSTQPRTLATTCDAFGYAAPLPP